jgi:Cu-Zn family superoxide dismutase
MEKTMSAEERHHHAWRYLWLPACLVVVLAGCQAGEKTGEEAATQPAATPEKAPSRITAVAEIAPKSGSDLTGEAVFTSMNGKVTLELTLEHATPGPHAVHIHETGDCSAEDASSAGGHWNPTGEEHGRWGVPPFHLGDIGNVDVGEGGKGTLTLETDLWAVGDGSDHDVLGKAVVVHEGPDDFTSQPAGAAGKRIGCGVIEMRSGETAGEGGSGY